MFILFGVRTDSGTIQWREPLAVARDRTDLETFLGEFKDQKLWGENTATTPYDSYQIQAPAFGDVSKDRWQPCDPDCRGLAIFQPDFDLPPGWVHIQRCDSCSRFQADEDAAQSISDRASEWCVDCGDWSDVCGSAAHVWRSIVPIEHAKEAGLDTGPWEGRGPLFKRVCPKCTESFDEDNTPNPGFCPHCGLDVDAYDLASRSR